jgi:aminoglycoside phosphotransferase (APT) family kinase protein
VNPKELAESSHPGATIRELAAGSNQIFRVIAENGTTTIMKVFPVASRERRERRALESLSGVPGVPAMIDTGIAGDMAWITMNDAGQWNLANLPKNLAAIEAAGQVLRGVHDAEAEITNLVSSIDEEYVKSHYQSTISRLGRFRRRFELEQRVLDAALEMTPPVASKSVISHTRPTPNKFVVSEAGSVSLVDWEWATLAPPEWDVSLAVWRFAALVGEDAAAAFRSGYGADLAESSYRPWVAYHSATMMLDAAEVREGRLGDLSYLVNDLTEAVLGT